MGVRMPVAIARVVQIRPCCANTSHAVCRYELQAHLAQREAARASSPLRGNKLLVPTTIVGLYKR
jgi:hypothetical protein